MDNSLRDKVTQLAARSQVLQKKGKFLQAIQLLEEVHSIKSSVLGPEHPQTDRAADRLCEMLNLSAMALLQRGQRLDTSLQLLKKAEQTSGSVQLRAVTLNNMGCYYRKTGKLRSALGFLTQALSTELRNKDERSLADTHLNMCAVLSELDRHEDSIKHAMLAIIFLQEQFLRVVLPASASAVPQERLSVLAIAYHNLGVQFQHIKRYEQAVKIYGKAKRFAQSYTPQNDQLIANLSRVLASATQQLDSKLKPAKKLVIQRRKDISNLYQDSRFDRAQKDLPRVKQSAEFDKGRSGRSFFRRRPAPAEGRARREGASLLSQDGGRQIRGQLVDMPRPIDYE